MLEPQHNLTNTLGFIDRLAPARWRDHLESIGYVIDATENIPAGYSAWDTWKDNGVTVSRGDSQ